MTVHVAMRRGLIAKLPQFFATTKMNTVASTTIVEKVDKICSVQKLPWCHVDMERLVQPPSDIPTTRVCCHVCVLDKAGAFALFDSHDQELSRCCLSSVRRTAQAPFGQTSEQDKISRSRRPACVSTSWPFSSSGRFFAKMGFVLWRIRCFIRESARVVSRTELESLVLTDGQTDNRRSCG